MHLQNVHVTGERNKLFRIWKKSAEDSDTKSALTIRRRYIYLRNINKKLSVAKDILHIISNLKNQKPSERIIEGYKWFEIK